MQSSNLSSLSPSLAGLQLVAEPGRAGFGAELVRGDDQRHRQQRGDRSRLLHQGPGGHRVGGIGGYGLLVNFGSQTQSPIPPPNTVVPSQPSEAGGTSNDNAPSGGSGPLQGILTTIGDLTDWVVQYTANPLLSQVTSTVHSTVTTVAAVVTIGTDPTTTSQANSRPQLSRSPARLRYQRRRRRSPPRRPPSSRPSMTPLMICFNDGDLTRPAAL